MLDALGVERPAWTEPPAMGADPDPVDACGSSPLWYAVRSTAAGIVVALIDAGADVGRRIELSARGERFTTILHEMVRRGRTVPLSHALARGVDPVSVDSDGATAIHVLGGHADNVNPEMVRTLVRAGVSVNAALPSGTQPIELAAQRILPATVAAMVELGAEPGRGLDALMSWWAVGAKFSGFRAADVVDILCAGGAEVTDRHLELAAAAGASQVESAVRR